MKNKTKYLPIVAVNFRDKTGTRIFCFQLCVLKERPTENKFSKTTLLSPGVSAPRRLEAHACLDFEGELLTRASYVPSLLPRNKAIEKLARKTMKGLGGEIFNENYLPEM